MEFGGVKIILGPNPFPNSKSLPHRPSQALPVLMGWNIIITNDASLKFIWWVNSAG